MGHAKAMVALADRPLIAYPIEALGAAGIEPVVIAKPHSELPPLDCRVVRERDSTTHPAAGILAALRAGPGGPVVVVACDMPFVAPRLLAFLAGLDAPAAVPRVRGQLQPLLARYAPSTAPALEQAIERGASLRETMRALGPLVVEGEGLARFGDAERMTFNVNDPHDLATAERFVGVVPSR
jgi:molybdenum cofactor guanylyltransferase